jgi:hypothetical protein
VFDRQVARAISRNNTIRGCLWQQGEKRHHVLAKRRVVKPSTQKAIQGSEGLEMSLFAVAVAETFHYWVEIVLIFVEHISKLDIFHCNFDFSRNTAAFEEKIKHLR